MTRDNGLYEWEGVIRGGGGDGSGAFVAFPWDLKTEFGKGNLVPVACDFDGVPYQGSLANMGSGPCLILVKAIREALGKGDGDTVRVRLRHDPAPRVVEAPDDLVAAWKDHPKAKAVWERLSTSHRREYVRWFDDARKPETRASRLVKAVTLLEQGRPLKA